MPARQLYPPPMSADVLDDLVAEQDRLEAILSGLSDDGWASPSAAAGWTVADVVLHLAQTEERVVASVNGYAGVDWHPGGVSLDDAVDQMVRAERAPAAEIFQRWRSARRAAVGALRQADPQRRYPWVAAPLKPRTLATTRLAEHWAHGLDITGPLGVRFPDTDRLRHIAWLGHSSLPYAFTLAGQQPHEVRCELTAPDGSTWSFGPPSADSTITGPAGAFCRVGARRLRPEDSGLVALGPHGPAALRVLRNYAG
jgi:uncharacterized protein (TIGR03084 family)